MHVFLSEYVTCGALAGTRNLDRSLAIEGAAMLRALAADAAQVAGWHVTVAWDASLPPFEVAGVDVCASLSPEEERARFIALTQQADITLVIAPEFDRILEDLCRLIQSYGGRSAGSSAEAVALCADKFLLAKHLEERDIATIPTRLCDLHEFPRTLSPKTVIKPRFGAGSTDTFVVSRREDVLLVRQALESHEAIIQPYLSGQALSVAGVVPRQGIKMWPVAAQHLTGSGQLHYAGGSVPADIIRKKEVSEIAQRAIAAVPGLYGYVGVDLILPDDAPPVVVEINPRLTSSYHAHRSLSAVNLAPRLLQPDQPQVEVDWRPQTASFLPDGTTRLEERRQ